MSWSFALVVLATGVARAQRIPIPQNTVADTFQQQGSVTGNPLVTVPRPGSQLAQAPSTTLGPPRFDPYTTNPNAASQPPSLLSPSGNSPSTGSSTTPFWQTPPSSQGGFVQPNYTQPVYPQAQGAQTFASPNYQVPGPTYAPGGYPQQPPVLFPNGVALPNWNLPQAQPGQYLRLFQDVRLTYTWVNGGEATDKLDINDVELATTVNFPNFFYSGQPLQVSPGFIFHFWDGPTTGLGPPPFPTELPARAYSTYLDFGWQPMITPQFGGDIDVSVGVFSDFKTMTTDSVRLQGTGLLVLGMTPTVALKGGVTYFDRLDVKLLPAGGILWRPNPQTRFDIYFPKPKLAQYLTTIGNTDVWWYLNGEYGGGSWTVSRTGVGGDRRMDINDIRAGGGFEWTCQSGVRGFVEAAYVFDRQLIFASGPIARQDLDDSVMVRGGLTY
ncbi:MAG: hypothetical protein O3C40_10780 [Planctomycetota bacterium]|nr:hypothetical protein [Planctomycetota bacterium]